VLAWAAQAVAPGAQVTQAAGLREGGNPWLLRLEPAGRQYRAVLKTGDPASARDRMQLRTQVAALALAGAEQILRREVDARVHAELLSSLQNQL